MHQNIAKMDGSSAQNMDGSGAKFWSHPQVIHFMLDSPAVRLCCLGVLPLYGSPRVMRISATWLGSGGMEMEMKFYPGNDQTCPVFLVDLVGNVSCSCYISHDFAYLMMMRKGPLLLLDPKVDSHFLWELYCEQTSL